jgi:hypothetical protein
VKEEKEEEEDFNPRGPEPAVQRYVAMDAPAAASDLSLL